MKDSVETWQYLLRVALEKMCKEFNGTLGKDHMQGTPDRIVRMYTDCLSRQPIDEAREVLRSSFKHDRVSQMIHVSGIQFTSWCAHHLIPFISVSHFAYIPNGTIVGLSKIPRLIEIVAARPQVQETLTDQVVQIFSEEVKPLGCGFVVDAQHMCMVARGVRKFGTWTRTTALYGEFFEAEEKAEFLGTVPPIPRMQ